jgi:hypothetical protein
VRGEEEDKEEETLDVINCITTTITTMPMKYIILTSLL